MTQGASLDKLEEGYAVLVSLKRMWEENSWDNTREKELQKRSRELRDRLVGVAGGRRLCKTKKGYLALVPEDAGGRHLLQGISRALSHPGSPSGASRACSGRPHPWPRRE